MIILNFEFQIEAIPKSELKNIINLIINIIIHLKTIKNVKYYLTVTKLSIFFYVKEKKIFKLKNITLIENTKKTIIQQTINTVLLKKPTQTTNFLFIIITNKYIIIKRISTLTTLCKKKDLIQIFEKALIQYSSKKKIYFHKYIPPFPRPILYFAIKINKKNIKNKIFYEPIKPINTNTIQKQENKKLLISSLQKRKELLRRKLLINNKKTKLPQNYDIFLTEICLNSNYHYLFRLKKKNVIIIYELLKFVLEKYQKLLHLKKKQSVIINYYYTNSFTKKNKKINADYTRYFYQKYLNLIQLYKLDIKKNLEKNILNNRKKKLIEKNTIYQQTTRLLHITNLLSLFINKNQKNRLIFLVKYSKIEFFTHLYQENNKLNFLIKKLYLQYLGLFSISRNFENFNYFFLKKVIRCKIFILLLLTQTIDNLIQYSKNLIKKNSKKKDPFGINNYLTILTIILKNIKFNINFTNFFQKIQNLYKIFNKKDTIKKLKKILSFINKKLLIKERTTISRQKKLSTNNKFTIILIKRLNNILKNKNN